MVREMGRVSQEIMIWSDLTRNRKLLERAGSRVASATEHNVNALGVDDEKIYKNKELADLISVMRCGIRDAIDIEKCRFDKIIVASDADDDGK